MCCPIFRFLIDLEIEAGTPIVGRLVVKLVAKTHPREEKGSGRKRGRESLFFHVFCIFEVLDAFTIILRKNDDSRPPPFSGPNGRNQFFERLMLTSGNEERRRCEVVWLDCKRMIMGKSNVFSQKMNRQRLDNGQFMTYPSG